MERVITSNTITEYEPKFADLLIQSNGFETRRNNVLTLNQEDDQFREFFSSELERLDAELLEYPISSEKAFSWFGLMLGTFPPMALFGKFIFQGLSNNDDYWIVPFLGFVNIVCGAAGYFSGKLIAKLVTAVENRSWLMMLSTLPLIGILWGIIAGGAGGIFIFVIGAIFGAIIAAMVGAIALPMFTILHRLLRKGDYINRGQFLPIAFGITFLISAFILGLPFR